jgi:hypothetical protein
MKINYIVECVVPFNDSWKWKQLFLCETLEDAKRMCGDKHRILNFHTLEEVYRTAPYSHFDIMAKIWEYSMYDKKFINMS